MQGHLYQRGKQKIWYLSYDQPSSVSGGRKQRNVRIGKMAKAEAETRKREILGKIDRGEWTEHPKKQQASEYLTKWLASRKSQLANKTHERYTQLINQHVLPVIGEMELTRIRPEDINGVYARMRSAKLSEQTCLHVHRVLHAAFAYAVRVERVLKENPIQRVAAPRPDVRDLPPLSRDQVRLLIEAVHGTRLEVPVLLAAVTGLRRGEILALRWSNVNLEKGSLYVAEALEHTRAFGVRFKAPKSKSSRRVVPLAPEAVAILAQHRTAQVEQKQLAGEVYADNDLVFCNPEGTPWPPDTFSQQFGSVARFVGLKGFRFHDLRHAFASISLADGVSIKEVQTLMGHSSPVVTLSVYARSMEGMGREAVNSLTHSLISIRGGSENPLPNVTKSL